MISIHFEQEQDCKLLFSQLEAYIRQYASLGLGGFIKTQGDDTILLDYECQDVNFYESFHPLLASILTDFVVSTKEEMWLLDIIETMFYFKDEEEQRQILTIAKSILEGDRDDIPQMKPFFNRKEFIYDAFAKHLEEETTFYYEPFLTFRLREYGECLIDCVEIAIDEYMLEQEYQNMIEDYRQHVNTNPTKMDLVYLVHENGFMFYDQHFRKLTKEELLYYLNEELIFEEEVDIDEMVISPLVSLTPRVVHVFSDEPDHGVILSIQSIFQERMKLYPLKTMKPNIN